MNTKNVIKKIYLLTLCIILGHGTIQAQVDYISNEIYVCVKEDALHNYAINSRTVALKELEHIFSPKIQKQFGIEDIIAPFHFVESEILRHTFRLTFTQEDKIEALLRELNANTNIRYAEKIHINNTTETPNDLGPNSSLFSTDGGQWYLYKMEAQEAWDITTEDPNIVVAVVDDAIDTTHPDLVNKCLEGYDVVDGITGALPPTDEYSHGTKITGVLGAETDNGPIGGTGEKMASIGYNIKVLPIRAGITTTNGISIYYGYEGIAYATYQPGVRIINMSWGSYGYGMTDLNIINDAWNQGIILVAAVGNDDQSLDDTPYYPASFDNVIAVAATGTYDEKWQLTSITGSNYGSEVDVSAPGKSIYTTKIYNPFSMHQYYTFTKGTSLASPLVAGLMALVWSVDPYLDRQEVIDCVLNTTDELYQSNTFNYDGLLGSGRINAKEAVLCALNKSCPEHASFYYPFYAGTTTIENASNTITGEYYNTINYGADITYLAGNAVLLEPGFHAQTGSNFCARIEECGYNLKGYDYDLNSDNRSQNFDLTAYPNPVTDKTFINYTLDEKALVELTLRDLAGRVVVEIKKETKQLAGTYQEAVDLNNISAGMYLYTLIVDGKSISKKLMIANY